MSTTFDVVIEVKPFKDVVRGSWVTRARCESDPEWWYLVVGPTPEPGQTVKVVPAINGSPAYIDTTVRS